jgi:hypothetical protein
MVDLRRDRGSHGSQSAPILHSSGDVPGEIVRSWGRRSPSDDPTVGLGHTSVQECHSNVDPANVGWRLVGRIWCINE